MAVTGEAKITGRELAALWSTAMIFATHLAGCSCAGFYVPLDPAAVQEDLIDFLVYRYKSDKRLALAEFVARREASFEKWLENLDSAPLDPVDRERLMDDLRNTLESMNGARAARSGFVCY